MLTGFLYGTLAAFFWSLTNIIDKYLTRKHAEDGNVWGIVVLSCFFPAGLLPIASHLTSVATDPFYAVLLMGTGVLMVCWIYFYLKALTEDDTSVVMTILILAPFFSLLFSNLILRESITLTQAIAGFFLISGSLIVSYQHESKKINHRLIFYALAASTVMGIMHTLFKFSTLDHSFWISVYWRSLGMVIAGIVLIILIRSIRNRFYSFLTHYIKRGLVLNSTNESLTLLGDTIFGFAILFAPIALVQTTEAYQPIFIILITFLLSQFGLKQVRERYDRKTLSLRLVGITAVIIGSAILILVG